MALHPAALLLRDKRENLKDSNTFIQYAIYIYIF